MSSSYKQKKYIEENFKFVAPKELVLNKEEVNKGAKKECVHYIPLVEAFKALVEDETFVTVQDYARLADRTDRDVFKDVKDGRNYKSNVLFKSNPQAHTMLLYSDAVELVNPLGASRGKHKIIQIFWSLAETPKERRSQIDR